MLNTANEYRSDLCEVQGCTVTTVVVVPVHVKDLFPLDGQETREDTFGQTGAENDDLIRHNG